MKTLNHICFVAICLLTLPLTSGCGGPSSVDAVPRASSGTPVFGASDIAIPGVADGVTVKKSNGLNLDFLHDDHFACVSIDVEKVANNEQLADVPWESLEEQIAELAGKENSQLSKIDRAWILIDRASLDFTAKDLESPLVVILDYSNPIDKDARDEATKVRQPLLVNEADKRKKKPAQIETKLIGDRRLVIGGKRLIAKIDKGSGGSSDLSQRIQQLELGTDVNGVLAMEPIRSTLQDFADTVSVFGGEKFKKLAALPDAIQRVELELSIDDDELLNLSVQMDDPGFAKEIAKLVRDSMAQGGGSGGPGMMPFDALMGGGAMGGGSPPKQMLPITSQSVMQEIGTDVSDNNLFSVAAEECDVVFRLQRPGKTNELIEAMLVDGRRQVGLVNRVEKLRRIGEALELYYEEHGFLPPSGVVGENDKGVPPQLNWRVGLLPFLGHQELYDQFDFSKDWDSKPNQNVAKEIPDVFDIQDGDGNSRCYFQFVGGDFGLHKDDAAAPKFSDLADKKIWSAIVVEAGKAMGTAWNEPGAISLKESNLDSLGVEDENGVLVLTASFDAKIIEKETDILRAILTTDGDESISRGSFLPLGF